MKKRVSGFLALTLLSLVFISCESKKENTPPELPPYESMAIDFSKFQVNDSKSAVDGLKSTETGTMLNYTYAALNVGVFNVVLVGTLAIPVTAFYHSFSQEPVFLENATWEWSYDYQIIGATYHARLTGEVRSEDVKWEMFISKEGIGAFEEFMWFEGTSLLDGTGGNWTLNYNHVYQEPLLQIDWVRSGEEVGQVTYTNVRELNDDRSENVQYGAAVEAGLIEGDPDAYYTIHVFDEVTAHAFIDVFIEWSTTNYNGHVKSESFYGDDVWHCWDSYGFDITCE